MVSALASGSSGPDSASPGIVLCSWARRFTLTVPLSAQVHKMVHTCAISITQAT